MKKLIGISAMALVLMLVLTLVPCCGGWEEHEPRSTPTAGATPAPRITPTPTPASIAKNPHL